jgi:hypothetical protein
MMFFNYVNASSEHRISEEESQASHTNVIVAEQPELNCHSFPVPRLVKNLPRSSLLPQIAQQRHKVQLFPYRKENYHL